MAVAGHPPRWAAGDAYVGGRRFPSAVLCTAYRIGRNRYRASSPELGIAVESMESLPDAQERLRRAIRDYLVSLAERDNLEQLVFARRLPSGRRSRIVAQLLARDVMALLLLMARPGAAPELATWREPIGDNPALLHSIEDELDGRAATAVLRASCNDVVPWDTLKADMGL